MIWEHSKRNTYSLLQSQSALIMTHWPSNLDCSRNGSTVCDNLLSLQTNERFDNNKNRTHGRSQNFSRHDKAKFPACIKHKTESQGTCSMLTRVSCTHPDSRLSHNRTNSQCGLSVPITSAAHNAIAAQLSYTVIVTHTSKTHALSKFLPFFYDTRHKEQELTLMPQYYFTNNVPLLQLNDH